MIADDEYDSQLAAECVGFLSKCSDNSFRLQNSLKIVKVLKDALEDEAKYFTSQLHKSLCSSHKFAQEEEKAISQDISIVRQQLRSSQNVGRELRAWGLPEDIVTSYEAKGITQMFDWQVECLSNAKVLVENSNLVYSAPTSAGKTLIAELMAIKTVLERQKKVIIILPFVSVVREKMFYFQQIFSSAGIRVEGFMGSHAPPGGFSAVHMAVCTIEKANSLVNKLLDDGNIADLGAVIVDEMHLLGDSSRGYILELLLTKVKFVTKKEDIQIQIIGMSATLPNLDFLSDWLEAELFVTDFRPIPLEEYCLVDRKIIDKSSAIVRSVEYNSDLDSNYHDVIQMCLETLNEGCSVLIFCTTKNWCESLSQKIASTFYSLGCTNKASGKLLREQLDTEKIREVLEQLQSCPVGLDVILKKTVSFGVAYHHAGLTFDERDIIEGAFKEGALRVLIATSTLSSGVNLPARRVIIRSPVFQKQPINILTYKQMIGRAGRMGKDTKGESILICAQSEKHIGLQLMNGALDSIHSCIEGDDKFMRAILEVIASRVASTKSELKLYTECTLLYFQNESNKLQTDFLEKILCCLEDFELVRTQNNDKEDIYIATPLGKACLSSSMAPSDGLSLFCELQKARQCLVLETDLHLIYLVTPYSVSSQWPNLDWLHLLNIWETLPKAMKRVGELIGIQESFIVRCVRGTVKFNTVLNKIEIHKRFYTALALQDLVNEVPLCEVSTKFKCCRGLLQSLQQSAATFAGMVTAFCHQLGWKNMEMLMSQFQDRLHFGIQSELLDLMRLPSLNGLRARSLYNAGLESVCLLASADVNRVENALHSAVPFQSAKGREDEDTVDAERRNKIKNIWITGHCGMTAKEAAENVIQEARTYLQLEMGAEIKWGHNQLDRCQTDKRESLGDCTNISQQPLIYGNILTKEISFQSKDSDHVFKNLVPDEQNSSVEDKTITSEVLNKYEVTTLEEKAQTEDNVSILQNNTKLTEIEFPKIEMRGTKSSDNISDLRYSDIFTTSILSPFTEEKPQNISKRISDNITIKSMTPDNSIFSSDVDSPNLFEESLSFDTQVAKIIEGGQTDISKTGTKYKVDCDIFNDDNESPFEEGIQVKDQQFSPATCDKEIRLNYDKEEANIDYDISLTDEEIPSSQDIVKEKFENTSIPINTSKLGVTSSAINEHGIQLIKKRRIYKEFTDSDFWKGRCEIKYVNLSKFDIPNSKIQDDRNKLKCIILDKVNPRELYNFLERKSCIAIFLNIEYGNKDCNKTVIGRNIIKKLSDKHEKTEPTSVQFNHGSLTGISINFGQNISLYLDCGKTEHEIINDLNMWLGVGNVRIHCYKFYYRHLKHCGLQMPLRAQDTSIMEWLIDSDTIEMSISRLIKKYCSLDTQLVQEDGASRRSKISNELMACVNSWGVWHVAEKQMIYLQEQYTSVHQVLSLETEISRILAESELTGLRVDKELAARFLKDVKDAQDVLQTKANKICGHRLNFNSSKDVAKALGIYNGRKVSTKKSVLSTHAGPLASIVTYWRKLNAILTRTLYPLTAKAALESYDGRIHPTYVTHTCTGRVSMQEPNLQNVPRNFAIPASFLTSHPTSDVMEFRCRDIFPASFGWTIVAADYCQLEMRILTHLCGDEVLTSIMRSDVDVFASIAASWGGVSEDKVDDDLRQKAKQLCYGIIYGMGNRTLAQQLDTSELEAASVMESFHAAYPAVRVYTSRVIEECRRLGYVETLKKRRRYLPTINSARASEKNAAERQAVNTAVQGSAADVAKAAMCAVDEHVTLCGERGAVRLLLQLHDELIYEVIDSKIDFFVDTLRTAMEQAVQLSVPLPVKIKAGPSWGCLEEWKR